MPHRTLVVSMSRLRTVKPSSRASITAMKPTTPPSTRGTYTIQLKKDDDIALEGDLTFEPGMVYDVVAIGRADDNSLSLLVLSASALVREGSVATPVSQGTAAVGTADPEMVDATTTSGEATSVPTAGAVEVTPTPS